MIFLFMKVIAGLSAVIFGIKFLQLSSIIPPLLRAIRSGKTFWPGPMVFDPNPKVQAAKIQLGEKPVFLFPTFIQYTIGVGIAFICGILIPMEYFGLIRPNKGFEVQFYTIPFIACVVGGLILSKRATYLGKQILAILQLIYSSDEVNNSEWEENTTEQLPNEAIMAREGWSARTSMLIGAALFVFLYILLGLPSWWNENMVHLGELMIIWILLVMSWWVGKIIDRTRNIHSPVFNFLIPSILLVGLLLWRPRAFFAVSFVNIDFWTYVLVLGSFFGLFIYLVYGILHRGWLAVRLSRTRLIPILVAILIVTITFAVPDVIFVGEQDIYRLLGANLAFASALLIGTGLDAPGQRLGSRILSAALGGLVGIFLYKLLLWPEAINQVIWWTAAGWIEFAFCGRTLLYCSERLLHHAHLVSGALLGGFISLGILLAPRRKGSTGRRWLGIVLGGCVGIAALTLLIYITSDLTWTPSLISTVWVGGIASAGLATGEMMFRFTPSSEAFPWSMPSRMFTNRPTLFNQAYHALLGKPDRPNYGPGPTIAFVFTRILPLSILVLWYASLRAWLDFPLLEYVKYPDWNGFAKLVFFSAIFTMIVWMGWQLGLRITPIRPNLATTILSFLLLLIVITLSAGILSSGLGSDEWQTNAFRPGLVAGASAGLLVLLTAILGAIAWCWRAITRNMSIIQLPKELKLRFWLGLAVFASLAAFGVLMDRVEVTLGFITGTLTVEIIASYISLGQSLTVVTENLSSLKATVLEKYTTFIISVPVGIWFASLLDRTNLFDSLIIISGSWPAVAAKAAVLILAGSLWGAACAALIGLASSDALN